MTKDCPTNTLRPQVPWYLWTIAAVFGLVVGWLTFLKKEPTYTLGSVGAWEDTPATLQDVLDERFPDPPR